jgi:uncharacterized membrane protein YhaH (DUF805 family)
MFVFALCVLPIVLATQVGDWTAVLIIGLAGSAHQAWSANLFTTVSDMFPKRAVASVTGIGGMAGSVGGMIFPIVAGALLDKFTASGNVTAGYAILFGYCAIAYIIAFGVMHLCAPKYEQVEVRGGLKRLGRLRYFLISNGLGIVGYGIVTAVLSAQANEAGFILSGIICLCFAGVYATFAIRRLYDLERPGWHFLLLLIPFYGAYLQLLLTFKKGTPGPNAYGDPPVRA